MKKLAITLMLLSFFSGCSRINQTFSDIWVAVSKLPPNPKPNPKIEPILPKEKKISYDELEKRVEVVVDSLNKNFPKGVIIYLKKEDKYLVMRIRGDNMLETILYNDLNPNIKEKINEFYLTEQPREAIFNLFDINASSILEQHCSNKIIFCDKKKYAIRESEKEDLVEIINNKEYMIFRGGYIISGRDKTEGRLEKMKKPKELYDPITEIYAMIMKRLTSR